MRSMLRIVLMVPLLFVVFSTPGSQAQCPGRPADAGICDTLYVEVWDHDNLYCGEPRLVRVPIRVTHDVPDPAVDSISGFTIPLCYTNTNPAKYCSLSSFWNSKPLMVPDLLYRSIFRHLPDMDNPEEHNRMLDIVAMNPVGVWDFLSLDLGDEVSHFWLTTVALGSMDQLWWEGSRVLLATMTFGVEDTTTVCIDSCFWPPSNHLAFCNSLAQTYIPRHNLPYCFSMTYPGRGDCDGNGQIDIGDVLFLLNYLFKKGPAPAFDYLGDANSDGILDVGDAVYLLGYLFRGGPPPG